MNISDFHLTFSFSILFPKHRNKISHKVIAKNFIVDILNKKFH